MVRLFLRISLAGSPAAAAGGRLRLGSKFSKGLLIASSLCVSIYAFENRHPGEVVRLRAHSHKRRVLPRQRLSAPQRRVSPSIAPVNCLGNPPEIKASYRNSAKRKVLLARGFPRETARLAYQALARLRLAVGGKFVQFAFERDQLGRR